MNNFRSYLLIYIIESMQKIEWEHKIPSFSEKYSIVCVTEGLQQIKPKLHLAQYFVSDLMVYHMFKTCIKARTGVA